ncbi:MAG: class I SAM-dependent methyltransferase [Acidimicrobiales bacterium]
MQLSLTVLDISETELAKAPAFYSKVQADITSPSFVPDGAHDLAFSRMLAEHVGDAETFHRNVRSLLKPGGVAIHLFPTLHTFPFAVNRLVPESVSTALVRLFHPGRDLYQHAKFPARYEWCRGPTRSEIRHLTSAGFEVDEFVAAFGHNYYTNIPLLRDVHAAKTAFLLKHPRPMLTSFAMVTLRKS